VLPPVLTIPMSATRRVLNARCYLPIREWFSLCKIFKVHPRYLHAWPCPADSRTLACPDGLSACPPDVNIIARGAQKHKPYFTSLPFLNATGGYMQDFCAHSPTQLPPLPKFHQPFYFITQIPPTAKKLNQILDFPSKI